MSCSYGYRRVERQRRWPEALSRRLATLPFPKNSHTKIIPYKVRNLRHSAFRRGSKISVEPNQIHKYNMTKKFLPNIIHTYSMPSFRTKASKNSCVRNFSHQRQQWTSKMPSGLYIFECLSTPLSLSPRDACINCPFDIGIGEKIISIFQHFYGNESKRADGKGAFSPPPWWKRVNTCKFCIR